MHMYGPAYMLVHASDIYIYVYIHTRTCTGWAGRAYVVVLHAMVLVLRSMENEGRSKGPFYSGHRKKDRYVPAARHVQEEKEQVHVVIVSELAVLYVRERIEMHVYSLSFWMKFELNIENINY